MTPPDIVSSFVQQHSIDTTEIQVEELDAIRCIIECHAFTDLDYANLPNAILENDLTIGSICQLYERCTDHIRGSLVAMLTSCAATSEVAARTSLEATVTIRYILRDRNLRLASYFRNHLDQAERQVRQWRSAAEHLRDEDRLVQLAACDYRAQGLEALRAFVARINSELVGSQVIPRWPNIAERFEAVGESIAYRTFYARLCAEPHFDAEETLRYIIGKSTDPAIFEKMAIETVMFSRFMLAAAVRAYAATGREYATAYDMVSAAEKCGAAEQVMSQHVANLSLHIGGIPGEAMGEEHQ